MQDQTRLATITVSVVMCTYNGEAYIAEQLQTILKQTYPLKEILIFDDASADGTTGYLKKIAAENPLVSLHINETNIGYTRNFEQALLAAGGDVIAIADQDDIWMKDKIERMMRAWKPGIPLIYCLSYLFEGKLPEKLDADPNFRRFEGTDARKIFLFNTVSGHALMIKKSFLQLVMPLTKEVTYDWWMAVVAAYNGGVQYLPEILVCQRLHTSNITVDYKGRFTKQEIKRRQKQTIINNCSKFATAPNMPEDHRNFALTFARLAKESFCHRFYWPLFLFIMKHRTILFNYKKRKVGFFSHLKHSYRRTAR